MEALDLHLDQSQDPALLANRELPNQLAMVVLEMITMTSWNPRLRQQESGTIESIMTD